MTVYTTQRSHKIEKKIQDRCWAAILALPRDGNADVVAAEAAMIVLRMANMTMEA